MSKSAVVSSCTNTAIRQTPRAVRLAAYTHRAEVRIEAASDVADGFHQLRHYFLEPLRVHAPPFFPPRYKVSVNNMRPLMITLLKNQPPSYVCVINDAVSGRYTELQWRENFCQRPSFDLQNITSAKITPEGL